MGNMSASIYSLLGHKLATHPGEVFPLHVGDTYMEPPEGCRMEDLSVEAYPGMHRYTSVQGHARLLDAIVERSRVTGELPVERDQVLVSAGATGGLSAICGTVLDPGDEVLILAPFWPLIAGIVKSYRGVPVPVPFFGKAADPDSAVALLNEALTERTVAIYFNTPSNPTGQIIPRPWLEALTEWARARGLWILADEVYDLYSWGGAHTYARPLAPERTFSAYSFSKAYGMAGNRCGYVLGPAQWMPQLRKISTHAFYSTPTASQLAAALALAGPGDAWAAAAAKAYEATGRKAAERLGVTAPEGSTFLFLDVAPALGERTLADFLFECADEGLFIAPGSSFGPYPTHVRLCFTSAPPDVVERGVEVLARKLGR